MSGLKDDRPEFVRPGTPQEPGRWRDKLPRKGGRVTYPAEVQTMDKKTAGKLLAILNDHGDYELGSGADHRVPIYLAAVDLLSDLRGQIIDSLDDMWDALADGDDPEQELREFIRYALDLEKLALLLHEVRS